MKFKYYRLWLRIMEKFGSQRAFAEAVGRSENTISKKLRGKMSITTQDICKWIKPEFLDILPEEIPQYFFASEVQEN